MTDRNRRRRRPSAWTTVTLSLGALLVVLNLLAWQLHAGGDPALGAGSAQSQDAK